MAAVSDSIPNEVNRMVESISIAKAYNNATGATITHKDVNDFGFIEFATIDAALMMIGNR